MTLMFIPNTYVENAKIIALPRHKIANVNNSAPSPTVKWRGELKLRGAIYIRARISCVVPRGTVAHNKKSAAVLDSSSTTLVKSQVSNQIFLRCRVGPLRTVFGSNMGRSSDSMR